MEQHKRSEIEYFKISAAGWSGTQRDILNFLKATAEPRGFVFHGNKWRKNFGDTLEFRCYVDYGKRSTWTFQLPLIFEIEHRSVKDLTFSTWQLDWLMPGVRYYRRYKSPEAAVLGMQAHIDLFDAIGELIVS